MISITILKDKRDGTFVLVDDEAGQLDGRYATIDEADQAAHAYVARVTHPKGSRIPQEFIERLLLAPDEENQCLGRLLASQAWPAFESWLNAERTDTPEASTRVLNAIATYSALMVAGVAKEHWPIDNPEVRQTIEKLVTRQLHKMLRAG